MSTPGTPPPRVAQKLLAERQALPGMLPQETKIFKAWWGIHSGEYTGADFNVRVGTGFDPGPSFDDAARKNWITNTQKRIDALLFQHDQPLIVEVKYRATPLIIGQTLCYALLYARQYPTEPQPHLLILCYQIDPDTAYCCDALGVRYEVVQGVDFAGAQVRG